jgi:hypothetical protein
MDQGSFHAFHDVVTDAATGIDAPRNDGGLHNGLLEKALKRAVIIKSLSWTKKRR